MIHQRFLISLLVSFLLVLPIGGHPLDQSGNLFRLHHRFKQSVKGAGGDHWRNSDDLSHLRSHDKLRQSRMLASADTFSLGGIADPNDAGLYFTEVQLGTPPIKYYVQVDTGSDLLWINCASCKGCPMSTQLGVRLALYDPSSSSTSSNIHCGDTYCAASLGECQTGQMCGYQLGYGDGSSSEGYFIKDILQLDIITENKATQRANATVVFGCGTSQGGELQRSDQALDGIMGFGQSNLSIITQLAEQKQASRVFAHCLEGEGKGGGILVIGNVQVSGLVYTPLIMNQPHYNVNLQSIDINGVSILVDSSVSGGGGTIIDSGTTLAYFSDEVYQRLLTAILAGVQPTDLFLWEGMTCASFTGSVDEVFPSVTFSFEGNKATMAVKPHDYLVQVEGLPGKGWCLGFQTPVQNSLSLNILGDLVLKDRLIVYDLEQQRVGWVDHDCSTNVTILSPGSRKAYAFASVIPTATIFSRASLLQNGVAQAAVCWLSFLLLLYNS